MGRFKTIFFVFLLSLIVQLGCSNKSETSRVSLVLPNWPTRASLNKTGDVANLAVADNIQVIIVNITGPGILTPRYFFWESHNSTAAPPTVIPFDVDRGENRLAQVLVVFEDRESGTMEFHYGDALKSITAATADFNITISPLQSGSARNGRLAGRYLRTDGHGPTGIVHVKYVPPGKPEMLLFDGFMYAGWFEIFTLENIGLSYYLGGDLLFKDAMSSSSTLVTTGPSTARIFVPKYYHQNGDSSSSSTTPRELSSGSESIVGYFGPGAGTKPVCFSQAITPIMGSYTTADLTNSTYLSWIGRRPIDGTKAGIALGGEVDVNCPAQTEEYTNHLRIDSSQVTHGDGVLGFKGPFRMQSTGGSGGWKSSVLASTTGSSSTFSATLNWKYMPDVFGSDGIGGVAIYVRSGTASANSRPDYERGEGIPCGDELEALGFSYLQDVAATSVNGTVAIPASIVSQANYTEGKFQAILCPYLRNPINGKRYALSGAVDYRSYVYSSNGGDSGGGGSGPGPTPAPPTKIVASKFEDHNIETSSTSRAQVMKDLCYPIRVAATNDQGYYGNMSGTATLTATSPTGGELLYNDAACTSGGTDTLTAQGFSGFHTMFMKIDGSQTQTTANISFAVSGGPTLAGTTFYASYIPYQPANKLVTLVQNSVTAYSCFPVDFRSLRDLVPSTFSSIPVTFNISVTPSAAASGWEFYPNMSDCQTGAQSSFTYSSQLEQHAVARYVGTESGSMTITPTTTDSNWAANSATIEGKTFNVVQPGAPASLQIPELNNSLPAEQCRMVHVVLLDSSSRLTPVKDELLASSSLNSMPINLNVTAGSALLSTESCSSAWSSSATVSIPELSAYNTTPVYIKATTSGTTTITATASSSSLAVGVSIAALELDVNISAAEASNVAVIMEGQGWNSTSKTVVGTPYGFVLNQSRPVTLLALTPSGDVPSSFSKNTQEIGLSGSQAVYTFPSSPVNFSGSVATINVTAMAAQSGVMVKTGGGSTGLTSVYGTAHNIYVASGFRLLAATSGISRDACQPILVQSIYSGQSSGPAIPISSTMNVTVAATSGNASAISFYDTPTCSTGAAVGSRAYTMTSGASQFIAYVKTNSSSGSYSLQATASSFGTGTITMTMDPSSVSTEANLVLQANSSNSIRRGMCEGIMVTRADQFGSAVQGGPLTVTLSSSTSGQGAGAFYTTPDCNGSAVTTAAIPSGDSSALIYYKYLGVDSSTITGNITATAGGLSSATYSFSGN